MIFFFLPSISSVIKEEGEEDEEEMEEEEEEGDEDDVDNEGEEENKAEPSQSNPDVKGSDETPAMAVVKQESGGRNKRVEEVGYSLLDGQDATEDEPEAASSSCSSDLSFGASSSGRDHKSVIDRLLERSSVH